jgi:DNA-binding SARP family transcriptional activator
MLLTSRVNYQRKILGIKKLSKITLRSHLHKVRELVTTVGQDANDALAHQSDIVNLNIEQKNQEVGNDMNLDAKLKSKKGTKVRTYY